MLRLYTHVDDDGYCAGAIVLSEFSQNSPTYIEYYDYDKPIKPIPEDIDSRDIVYITDLAYDDEIEKLINTYLSLGCRVVYIDHHQIKEDKMKHLYENNIIKNNLEKFTYFHMIGVSASLLTWIYACMNEDERSHINFNDAPKFHLSTRRERVVFGAESNENHPSVINNNDPTAMEIPFKMTREYHIPQAIRYIDDNDVWLNENEETKYFHAGFQIQNNKKSDAPIWVDLLYSNMDTAILSTIIDKGRTIYEYQTVTNEANCIKNAFVTFIGEDKNIPCLCLNSSTGNSRLFGERFLEDSNIYPVFCKFHYDGLLYKYTLYSTKSSGIEVNKIAQQYNGGGHKNAAGFTLNESWFDVLGSPRMSLTSYESERTKQLYTLTDSYKIRIINDTYNTLIKYDRGILQNRVVNKLYSEDEFLLLYRHLTTKEVDTYKIGLSFDFTSYLSEKFDNARIDFKMYYMKFVLDGISLYRHSVIIATVGDELYLVDPVRKQLIVDEGSHMNMINKYTTEIFKCSKASNCKCTIYEYDILARPQYGSTLSQYEECIAENADITMNLKLSK